MKSACVLVLCRTPLQSVIIQQVLKEEGVDFYDIVYLTYDNSEEDRYYYDKLSALADKSQYLNISRQRYDILSHINIYLNINVDIKKKKYSKILVSSIDNLSFRKIVVKNKEAELITFDDGLKNILLLKNINNNIRQKLYEFAFGVPAEKKVNEIIIRHYSIYKNFTNIMPTKIVKYIDIVNKKMDNLLCKNKIKFFIGQPFKEYMSDAFISKLKNYIIMSNFKYYVKHPREIEPLVDTIPLLQKNGKIAEEAIFAVCDNCRPMIVGSFSSVMFNISADYADKVILLDKTNSLFKDYVELSKKANCQVVCL